MTSLQDVSQLSTEDLAHDDDDSHVRGKQGLDPQIIRSLENDILHTMAGSNPVDPVFSGLPDSSVDTQFGSTFAVTTSFTMESFTVESVTTTAGEEQLAKAAEEKGCCGRSKISVDEHGMVTQKSGKPLNVGENKAPKLLSIQPSDCKGKITLCLDLDETLVHSSFLAIPHADFRFILGIDNQTVGVFLCVRPGAEKLLRELGNIYEIVIFTASSQLYADTVIDFIDKGKMVKHRLYRESCTDFGGNYVKDLSRLNRNLEKVIIVDNSPVAYLLQPYNAIAISSWYDDPTDTMLFELCEFLKANHRAKSVYEVLVADEDKQH